VSAYARLYRRVLFPLYESGLRRRKTLRYLAELEASQWLSPEETRARQWERLLAMLRYCEAQVPYYGRLFAERGVRADAIQTPEDFRKRVPLLSKQAVRLHQEELVARPCRGRKLHSLGTSGSSGIPVRVKLDHDAYERRLAGWIRGDRWAGWDIGEKMFHLVGGRPMGKTTLLKEAKKKAHQLLSRQKIVTALSMSPEVLMRYHRQMMRFRPVVFVGYANSVYHFARFIRESGLSPYRPRAIITMGEKIFAPQRRTIEEVFQVPVFERYGCVEFNLIAAECDRHRGLHVNCDNLYVEILDERGEPAAPGEMGEVVVTSLHNLAMPLVRYRVGDLARWATQECDCGRGLPLIAEVLGRTLDMIVTRSGRICTGIVFPYILDEFPCVAQYQVVQRSPDDILVRLVPGQDFQEAKLAEIERGLRQYLGHEVGLHFEVTHEIPLTETGKFRYTRSEVPVRFGQADPVAASERTEKR